MYRAYNIDSGGKAFRSDFVATGKALHDAAKREIEPALDEFVIEDGLLRANDLQQHWFPTVEADVFISHSHADSQLAMGLAGWLHDALGIKAFIDSAVWGYAPNLQQILDDKYCRTGDGYYDYQKRNRSTSHVHMLLTTALTAMMDSAECAFFINTPASILPSGLIGSTSAATLSPWLYHELTMMRLLRVRPLERRLIKAASARRDALKEDLVMAFEVNLGSFRRLDFTDLNEWSQAGKRLPHPQSRLDYLYAHYTSSQ